jgi:hypothetical protein
MTSQTKERDRQVTIEHLRPQFTGTFPVVLEAGVIYISIEFSTCAHLCACGCDQEVFTPLSPAQWAFTYNGKEVSLRPSIGNWTLPCQSHYVVDRGRVHWARQFSEAEIARNRSHDRYALEADDWTTDKENSDRRQTSRNSCESSRPGVSWWGRLLHKLARRT